jgi:competence ComEA-like helix-hairpin-helix protein
MSHRLSHKRNVVIPRSAATRNLHFVPFSLAVLFVTVVLAAFAAQKKAPPAAPVDLNAATAKELAELPGVGKVTATAIIQFRQKAGPFRRIEDLLAVRGISPRKLQQIKPYVFVKPAAAARPPIPPKPATPAKSTPAKP